MKRILAVFLTLAMALNIAPVSAFAASDSDAASIAVVEETDDSTASAWDDETVQAVASDPFLQGQAADAVQTEEEEQNAEVSADSTEVKVTATSSFGQLLADGIEQQNSMEDGKSRILKVAVSGSSADVEYVAAEEADLVVAVYTEEDAMRMVASGTVGVEATSSEDGSAVTTVQLEGEMPKNFLVKAFLLDKTEHAPLSNEYTETAYTKAMEDLADAKTTDYPEDRVIDLDGNVDTNFVVVNEDVLLLKEEEVTEGEDVVRVEDSDTGTYVIDHASETIRNLKEGQILTYEYEPGRLLIARVKTISVDGDTVTIEGDDTLAITDVFDSMKIEQGAGIGNLVMDTSKADEYVTYMGRTEDTENGFFDNLAAGFIADDLQFDSKVDEFSLGGSLKHDYDDDLPAGATPGASVALSGTVSLTNSLRFTYYLSKEKQYVCVTNNTHIWGDVTLSGAYSIKINLAEYNSPPEMMQCGLNISLTPRIVLSVTGAFTTGYDVTKQVGFSYENGVGFQDKSTKAVGGLDKGKKADWESMSITGYVGVEAGPEMELLIDLLKVGFTLSTGIEATYTPEVQPNTEVRRHECGAMKCMTISSLIKTEGKISLTVFGKLKDIIGWGIKKEESWKLMDDIPLVDNYWSQTYGEYEQGPCPHITYRVNVAVPQNMDIYEVTPAGETLFALDAGGTATAFLHNGTYELIGWYGNRTYTCKFTVQDEALDVAMRQTTSGSCGENVTWNLEEGSGLLTIEGTGAMQDYGSEELTKAPWQQERVKIVLVKPGVTAIGSYAFAECSELTSVTLDNSITQMGEDAFKNCSSLRTVKLPTQLEKLPKELFYACSKLTTVTMSDQVQSIGNSAFYLCNYLTDIYYNGTREAWVRVGIGPWNDPLKTATVHCSNGKIEGDKPVIVKTGTCGKNGNNLTWTYTLDGTLTISGKGAMQDYEDNNSDPLWYVYESSIRKVIVEEGVTTIGSKAFHDYYHNLEEVVLPSTLKEIHYGAFYKCPVLTTVLLNEGLESIGNHAFYGCSSLENIDLPKSLKTIGDYVFTECTTLKQIRIPEKVTSIGDCTFWRCSSLTHAYFLGSMEKLGGQLFGDCTSLKVVSLPKGLKYLCGLLGDDIPYGLLFSRCSSLESVTIPEGVETIYGDTFSDCTSLHTVYIPKTVTEIVRNAFYGCTNLSNIYYDGTLEDWLYYVRNGASDDYYFKNATLHCTDRTLLVSEAEQYYENSVTDGTASGDVIYTASFAGLTKGISYAVIISKSADAPLAPENLISIQQFRADSETLDWQFRTRSADITDADMLYVVAAGSRVIAPDPTDADDPGQGGDASGAIIVGVIAVGVAAAAVAGVVLMMPVKVEGVVKSADQPVANASVQILQGGDVKAETVTDANGHFAAKVRRGSYTLRVCWMDAEGQLVTRTVDFKAPNADLQVAA